MYRQPLGPRILVTVIVDGDAHRDAGIVDHDIEPAEMRRDVADDGCDGVAVGDVERPGSCGAAFGGNFGGDGLGCLGVDVGDGDVGALGGEHQRGGASHAAGGAGDKNGQALDRAAELLEI